MPEGDLTRIFAERLEHDLPPRIARPIDRDVVARVTPLIRERVKVLAEVAGYCDFFFTDELHYAREELLGKAFATKPGEAAQALGAASTQLESLASWTHNDIEASMRALAEQLGAKAGDLFSLVRVAVTGRRVTPPLFESMEILGRERCFARLRAAAAKLA
jgi:glutamyl-tRNA synthetase